MINGAVIRKYISFMSKVIIYIYIDRGKFCGRNMMLDGMVYTSLIFIMTNVYSLKDFAQLKGRQGFCLIEVHIPRAAPPGSDVEGDNLILV